MSVRVRVAPSPTGDPHVGTAYMSLFNLAFARQQGGEFLLRVEDTDRARFRADSEQQVYDMLRWLGLDWDEGPDKGGPRGPYRQSERLEIYAAVAADLQESGAAYPCFCSPAELEARREEARRAGRAPGYDGRCRDLTPEQEAAYRAEGRRPVLRFRMPDGVITFDDLVRGEVSFDSANVPDFVLSRADGHPLYTLAATVDDVLMGMTHILRGEDLLSSTPRQIAVYAAMGVAPADFPRFGHLPFVMGADNQKLSKRNGEVSIAWYRREGFLPETMVNYLALLGWSLGDDRELFGLEEMAAAFTVDRVNRNPARFDVKKLEAINGDKIRGLSGEDFAARLTPFLQSEGLVATPPTTDEARLVMAGAPLVQERIARLTEGAGLLRFLFVDEAHFVVDPQAAARVMIDDADAVLAAAYDALSSLTEWTAAEIEAALRSALVEGMGLKPRTAFSPVRVAVTGSAISPPLFESLELLGRDHTLARLAAARAAAGPVA